MLKLTESTFFFFSWGWQKESLFHLCLCDWPISTPVKINLPDKQKKERIMQIAMMPPMAPYVYKVILNATRTKCLVSYRGKKKATGKKYLASCLGETATGTKHFSKVNSIVLYGIFNILSITEIQVINVWRYLKLEQSRISQKGRISF